MRQIFTLLWLLVSADVGAQAVDSLGLRKFQDAVLAFQNKELISNGTVAVSIRNTQDGRVIFSANSNKSLPAASILKLVTTATAMELLGASYRFQTHIEYDGSIQADTLFGNIYLRGMGDPSLGSPRFPSKRNDLQEGIRVGMRKIGIKHIQGDIFIDESFFNGNAIADTWLYEDLAQGYGTGVHALNFNENQVRIKLKAGTSASDSVAIVGVYPALAGLQIRNQIKIVEKPTNSRIRIYGMSQSQIDLQGELQVGSAHHIQAAMPNPGIYAIQFFRESIDLDSITFTKQIHTLPFHSDRHSIYVHPSPTLKELIRETNWWSINLYADTFLKMIGKKGSNDASFESSVVEMRRHWENKKVDLRGFYIKDGSGLSGSGSVTADNMTDLLNAAAAEPSFENYLETIPILGKEGTLRGLGGKSKALNRIRAKSGSLEGTRTYAGYVQSKQGHWLSFALMAHMYQPDQKDQVKKELVELMVLLADL